MLFTLIRGISLLSFDDNDSSAYLFFGLAAGFQVVTISMFIAWHKHESVTEKINSQDKSDEDEETEQLA